MTTTQSIEAVDELAGNLLNLIVTAYLTKRGNRQIHWCAGNGCENLAHTGSPFSKISITGKDGFFLNRLEVKRLEN